eukprot:PhM_4_TR11705/c0_g1_i4/m.86035
MSTKSSALASNSPVRTHASFSFLVLTLCIWAAVLVSDSDAFSNYNHAYMLAPQLEVALHPSPSMGVDGSGTTQQNFWMGQEARLKVSVVYGSGVVDAGTGNPIRSVMNISSVGTIRVRVISAFAGRATTGTQRQLCNATAEADVWAEYWQLSTKHYLFGGELAANGFATFTVPPFPFRVCVKVVSDKLAYQKGWKSYNYSRAMFLDRGRNAGWREPINTQLSYYSVNRTAAYVWYSSSTMHEGDYAAIRVVPNAAQHIMRYPKHNSFDDGDIVKLVPAGMSCTYEKASSRDSGFYSGSEQYCGSNMVSTSTGNFLISSCIYEGSVKDGVARVGTTKYNPFSPRLGYGNSKVARGTDILTAYLRLPAAGSYDICYSSVEHRKTFRFNRNLKLHPSPVWFKVFKASTNCPTGTSIANSVFNAHCAPTTTQLTITTDPKTLRWSSVDMTPGTWGAIKITDTTGTTLNNNPATKWDHSNPPEYFTTEGGDQFRIVRSTRFGAVTPVAGDIYYTAAGSRLKMTIEKKNTTGSLLGYETVNRVEATSSATFGASGNIFRQYYLGPPFEGSPMDVNADSTTTGGCWYDHDDNYGDYATGLNGITAEMRGKYENGACCEAADRCSSTSCSMSDDGDLGVTASADLGTNPRAFVTAWKHDATSQRSVYAYIRFPTSYFWKVCYRKAGTENWRVLDQADSHVSNVLHPFVENANNITYHMNDTRAGTLAELRLFDTTKSLNTLDYGNYWSTSVADKDVTGSMIKMVPTTHSCYVHPGVSGTVSMKPGVRECSLQQCNFGDTCSNCLGSADDSSVARHEIVFFITLPAHTSPSTFRVCFRRGHGNWHALNDPNFMSNQLQSSGWKFFPKAPPQIDFELQDMRAGTWSRLLIRRVGHGTTPFTISKNTVDYAADVVRIVPNVTSTGEKVNCDVTWGVAGTASTTAGFAQRFDAAKLKTDLGLYCTGTTSLCSASRLDPTDGEYHGMFPYNDIDSTAEGHYLSNDAENAVAFLYLPPAQTQSFRLCYKQRNMNWIDVSHRWDSLNPILITTTPTHAMALHRADSTQPSTVLAGSYGYIRIYAGSINLNYDLVKLVASTDTCDRPAVGSHSYGNKYGAMSWRKHEVSATGADVWTEGTRGGQAFVADSNPTAQQSALGTRATVTSARAYMTFPTTSNMDESTTTYRVCYMHRKSGSDKSQNWQLMGTINVKTLGITYTVLQQPYNGAPLTIRFFSTSQVLNTDPFIGDMAKVVDAADSCSSATQANRPYGVYSRHVGQELYLQGTNLTAMENGIDDLGPNDVSRTPMTEISVTLPWDAFNTKYYRVCYLLKGQIWTEIEQAALSRRVHSLPPVGIEARPTGVVSFEVADSLRAQAPYTAATYGGRPYGGFLVAGASTSEIVAYPSQNMSKMYVTFTLPHANYAKDQYKLVVEAQETSPGVYTPVAEASCESPSEISSPGPGSSTSRVELHMNLPTRGGRYFLCYRKSDAPAWVRVPSATSGISNPFTIIPSSLSFEVTSTGATIRDFYLDVFDGKELGLGALGPNDAAYIINGTGVCGMSHGFAYINALSAASALGVVQTYFRTAYETSTGTESMMISRDVNIAVPTALGRYKVCYYRAQQVRTNGTALGAAFPKPYVPIGWYQIPSFEGDALYTTVKAARLRIDGCPIYNKTYSVRPGTSFEMTVSVLDSFGVVLPYPIGTYAYKITAIAEGGFTLINTRGDCGNPFAPGFNWLTSNLQQYTSTGVAVFRLTVQSACPPETDCYITFAASNGIAAPGGSNLLAEPARCPIGIRKVNVGRTTWTHTPTACHPDDMDCKVVFVGYASDYLIAFSDTSDVTAVVTGLGTGLGLKINGVSTYEGVIVKVGSMIEGYFNGQLTIAVNSGLDFTADTTVKIVLTVRGISLTHDVVIRRPTIHTIRVTNLYADFVALTDASRGDMYIRPFTVPAWRPTTGHFKGGVDMGDLTLTAAPANYLVAQQHYVLELKAYDQYSRPIVQPKLLTGNTITLSSASFGTSGNTNAVLDKCLTEQCNTGLPSIEFSTPTKAFMFRIRNNQGCSASSPCNIDIKLNGVTPAGGATTITTPVRSPAVRLRYTCWSGAQEVGSTTTEIRAALELLTSATTVCPSSVVESGWTIKVEAVDQYDKVDDFFEGNLFIVYTGSSAMNNISTVAGLQGGTPAGSVDAKFIAGVAWIHKFTLLRPCTSGCSFGLLSDWGAGMTAGSALVAQASTRKLQCTLSTSLRRCESDTECTSDAGPFTYDPSAQLTNRRAMIHADTKICVSVAAVNNAVPPVSTLYETNWVMAWVEHLTGPTVTFRDAAGTGRVQALTRSGSNFCFYVSSTAMSTFRIKFIAQRFSDAGYWATGVSGECQIGTLTVWPKKVVTSIAVKSVTGSLSTLGSLPSAGVQLYGQRPSAESSMTAGLQLAILDPYGLEITTDQVPTTASTHHIVIDTCTVSSISSRSCETQTQLDATSGPTMFAVSEANTKEGGLATITVAGISSAVTSPVLYTLATSKHCLGCYVRFRLKDKDSVDVKINNVVPSVQVSFYILIHSTAQKYVAYRLGTSPQRYWQYWDLTSQSTVSASKGNLVLFRDSCFIAERSACAPLTQYFVPTMCDESVPKNSDVIGRDASKSPIQVYIVASERRTGALNSNLEPQCSNDNCSATTNVHSQIDILNDYELTLSVGNQILSCVPGDAATTCSNDLTIAPKVAIKAMGKDVKSAILAYIAKSNIFNGASFTVRPTEPSEYYTSDATGALSSATDRPSYYGAFSISHMLESSATTTTGVSTSPYVFAFRGPRQAHRFVMLPSTKEGTCTNKPMFTCLSTDPADKCRFDGHETKTDLTSMNFSYAFDENESDRTTLPSNVFIPFTFEVQDAYGVAVPTAAGRVSANVTSWKGCNNGGTITVRDALNGTVALKNGRATLFISFSDPCELCVLRAYVIPESTQSALYAQLYANPSAMYVRSKPIRVRDTIARSATHMVVTSSPSLIASKLTVKDVVDVDLAALRRLGARYATIDSKAAGSVAAYAVPVAGSSTFLWYGNGGLLRSKTNSVGQHASMTSFSETGVLRVSFSFSRTCYKGCHVTLSYNVNGNVGNFVLKNSAGTVFTVETAATKRFLVGYRPRLVMRGSEFSFATWLVGSEDADNIPEAGVALSSTFNSPAVSFNALDTTYGDGGILTFSVVPAASGNMFRASVSTTCAKCQMKIDGDSFIFSSRTTATRLRAVATKGSSLSIDYPMLVGTEQQYFSFDVLAVDEAGVIDLWASGVYTQCHAYVPPLCGATQTGSLSCEVSANYSSNIGFTPSTPTFRLAPVTRTCVQKSDNKFIDGVGRGIKFQFSEPVREGYPVFSINGLTSLTSDGVEAVKVNVPHGRTGMFLAVEASDLGTVSTTTGATFEFGATRFPDANVVEKYVSAAVNNAVVSVTLKSSCPSNSAFAAGAGSMQIPLVKGYAKLALSFYGATNSTAPCEATFTLIGDLVCSSQAACTSTQSFFVSTPSVSSWVWLSPSSADNGGLPAGPLYGATNQRTVFTAGLMGTSNGMNVRVKTCDDSSTPGVVEECVLTLAATTACFNPPTIDGSGTAVFGPDGTASVTLTWANAYARYNCPLTATVRRAADTIAGPSNADATVEVCQPYRLVDITNTSNLGRPITTSETLSYAVKIVDPFGQVCRGDSGLDATQLTVSSVTKSNIQLINRNPVAVANESSPNVVRVVSGHYTFAVQFSNSSLRDGSQVQIRVLAQQPLNFSTASMIVSQPIDTTIAASRIVWDMAPKPSVDGLVHIVRSRPMQMSIRALDAINPSWFNAAPNVPMHPHEFGSDARVMWNVEPLPPFAEFPIKFLNNTRDSTLQRGVGKWVVSWEGTSDSDYRFFVAPLQQFASLQRTAMISFRVQTISRLALALGKCSTSCSILPGTMGMTSSAVYERVPYLVDLVVLDPSDNVVLGDNESYVEINSPTTGVFIAQPPTYANRGVVGGYVRQGRVTLNITFIGTTDPNAPLQLTFTCPEYLPGTKTWNPCRAQSAQVTFKSNDLYVYSNATQVPDSVWTDTTVQTKKTIMKIPTSMTSLTQLDIDKFKALMSNSLVNQGFNYMYPGVIETTACEVSNALFGSADLGYTVCGAQNLCAERGVNCPFGVLQCACGTTNPVTSAPAATMAPNATNTTNNSTNATTNVPTPQPPNATTSTASASASRRFLMQSSAGSSRVQLEVNFNLKSALGFTGTTATSIAAEYERLGQAALTAINTEAQFVSQFKVNTAAVTTRSASQPPTTAAPATQAPPTLPPSTRSPNTTAPVPGTNGAVNVSSILHSAVLFVALVVFGFFVVA